MLCVGSRLGLLQWNSGDHGCPFHKAASHTYNFANQIPVLKQPIQSRSNLGSHSRFSSFQPVNMFFSTKISLSPLELHVAVELGI